MPASAMALSSSAISAALPSSPSPSCFWIAAICSRSSTSRWRSSSDGLGLPADLLRQPQHLDAVRQHARDLVHPRREVDGLQDLLLLFRLHVHIGGRQIGKRRRRLDRLDRGEKIGRRLRQQLDRFDGLRLQIDEPRLDFRRARVGLRNAQHARDQKRPAGEIFDDLEALLALADDMMGAVRRGDEAQRHWRACPCGACRSRSDRRPRLRAATGCRPGAARAPPAARPRPISAGRA